MHNYNTIVFGKKSQYRNLSNYIIILKVDAEMAVIFVDFSREKCLKKSFWLTWIGRKLLILSFQSKTGDVLSGCRSGN